MAGYQDQIPRHLAVRRKALAAAEANPATLATCWHLIRNIANLYQDHVKQTLEGGCTFPDRPIDLAPDDQCLVNFGAAPATLRRDLAWRRLEEAGGEVAQGAPAPEAIPETDRPALAERYARLARAYAPRRESGGVYNLVPWLQDMYRDLLDIDFAEELEREVEQHQRYMESVPRALDAANLPPAVQREVLAAFELFRKITGSSHQIEREKMSTSDKRHFATIATQIENALRKADDSASVSGAGRSPARELFGFWKDANYEVMKLQRQLRGIWSGTGLDARIQELGQLQAAVAKTAARCAEEDDPPRPQCPLADFDETGRMLDRARVEAAFRALTAQHFVAGADDGAAGAREARRHGPLSVLLVPGGGRARYAAELRAYRTERAALAEKEGANERSLDVNRRVRYPANLLVVPLLADPDELETQLAEAWLEYMGASRGRDLKETLEALKPVAPGLFTPPPEGMSAAAHARRRLARYTAAFVAWAAKGTVPNEGADYPDFEAFRAWAAARHGEPLLLLPPAYQPLVAAFREAGAVRREELWRRALGPRYRLDRQQLAFALVERDFDAFWTYLERLPTERQRHTLLDKAKQERGGSDLFGDRDRRVEGLLRKYMLEDAELKNALLSAESTAAVEMEASRKQAESLGRSVDYAALFSSVCQRQQARLRLERARADRFIDQYLVGLYHVCDQNWPSALAALASCLTRTRTPPPPPDGYAAPDAPDEAWFGTTFASEGMNKFARRAVPGVDAPGATCVDYVFYNLGQVYRKLGRDYEARLAFHEFADQADARGWHLWGEVAKAWLATPAPEAALNA